MKKKALLLGFLVAASILSFSGCKNIELLPEEKRIALAGILSLDPRPAYQDDPDKIYGLNFAGHNVRFRIHHNTVTVLELL